MDFETVAECLCKITDPGDWRRRESVTAASQEKKAAKAIHEIFG
jgi:hypothetical protein